MVLPVGGPSAESARPGMWGLVVILVVAVLGLTVTAVVLATGDDDRSSPDPNISILAGEIVEQMSRQGTTVPQTEAPGASSVGAPPTTGTGQSAQGPPPPQTNRRARSTPLLTALLWLAAMSTIGGLSGFAWWWIGDRGARRTQRAWLEGHRSELQGIESRFRAGGVTAGKVSPDLREELRELPLDVLTDERDLLSVVAVLAATQPIARSSRPDDSTREPST